MMLFFWRRSFLAALFFGFFVRLEAGLLVKSQRFLPCCY